MEKPQWLMQGKVSSFSRGPRGSEQDHEDQVSRQWDTALGGAPESQDPGLGSDGTHQSTYTPVECFWELHPFAFA